MKKILSFNLVVRAVNLWCYLIAPLIITILLVKGVDFINKRAALVLLVVIPLYWFIYGSVAFSFNNRLSNSGYIVKQYRNFTGFFQFMIASVVVGLMLLLISWVAIKLLGSVFSRLAEFILLINSALCSSLVFFQYFLLPDENA